MIDKDDPRQAAEDCRRLADFLERCRARPEIIAGLREEADKLDPLDRSLRGWVLVTEPCRATWVWRAYENGLADREETMTWGEVEKRGWQVEQLHVLQPGEVAVEIPPVSEWPRSATYIGVYYANDRGPIDEIFSIDREQAERMEAERG